MGSVNTDTAAVYRAIHCGFYPAKILARRPDGRIDLEIYSLSDKPLLVIGGIVLASSPAECRPGQAFIGDLPAQ